VEEHFVWMTTRQIEPGTLTDFERACRPGTHPEGMLPIGRRMGGKSSGSRSGPRRSRARHGGRRGRRPGGGRRWLATSLGSRSGSTAAAGSLPLLRVRPVDHPATEMRASGSATR
jgi:hypothetical protein